MRFLWNLSSTDTFMSLEKKKNQQKLPHANFENRAAVAARWAHSYVLIQDHVVFFSLWEILSSSDIAVWTVSSLMWTAWVQSCMYKSILAQDLTPLPRPLLDFVRKGEQKMCLEMTLTLLVVADPRRWCDHQLHKAPCWSLCVACRGCF